MHNMTPQIHACNQGRRTQKRSSPMSKEHSWERIGIIRLALCLLVLFSACLFTSMSAFAVDEENPDTIKTIRREGGELKKIVSPLSDGTAHEKKIAQKVEDLFDILMESENDAQVMNQLPRIYELLGGIGMMESPNTLDMAEVAAFYQHFYKIKETLATIYRADVGATVTFSNDDTSLIPVLVGCILLVLALVGIALFSRRLIFKAAADKDKMAEIAMKQTFGLPVGSVRGIMALLISLLFILSIFLGADRMKEIPEVIKVIVSLVFGFYFAKSTDQSKDLMDAMLGKGKQQALKRQTTLLAIEDARKAEAETLAPDLFSKAQEKFSTGDQSTDPVGAIQNFDIAFQAAGEAKAAAIGKNRERYNALAEETEKRIFDLSKLKIDHRAVHEIFLTSRAQYERGSFQDAAKTLDRVKGMVDLLLQEYDEAKKIYEEKLTDTQRQSLAAAKEKIDAAGAIDVDGGELVSGLISIMGILKEKGENLLPLFKKRVMGQEFDALDVRDTFERLKLGGNRKKLSNVVSIAVNHIGEDAAGALVKLLKGDLLQQVVTADDGLLGKIFNETVSKTDVDEATFRSVVGKIRKNLVDGLIEDGVKQGLPESVSFDAYKKTIRHSQEDTDKNGVLDSVMKVLDVGETILSFTPYGGIAKIARAVGKGLFKIFGN